MKALQILPLVQGLAILALAVVLMFPRRQWSQRIRLPAALVAFVSSLVLLTYRIV